MWQFESLADFGYVIRWLDRRHRKNKKDKALGRFFRCATPILRDSIEQYEATVHRLDSLCDGLYSKTCGKAYPGAKVSAGMTLIDNLHYQSRRLRLYFDKLKGKSTAHIFAHWQRVFYGRREYVLLLRRLIGDFGNFEALLPVLPGTGTLITDPKIQQCMAEMYDINTRNLRILELMQRANKAWYTSSFRINLDFIEPNSDMAEQVDGMLNEYLIQADPMRVKNRQLADERAGKRFTKYRFWRAAESMRLMSQAIYVDSQRKPVTQRRFVDTHLKDVPIICTDYRRLEWSLKEVFNNALTAVSRLYLTDANTWAARPLPRHAKPNPSPAITISLQTDESGKKRGKKSTILLTVVDEGVGIEPQHLPYLALWGYSPRREEFRQRAREAKLTQTQLQQEIQIGGKGIGLAYADTVIREHGGSLHIDSTPGEGTTVTIKLPAPTPLPT